MTFCEYWLLGVWPYLRLWMLSVVGVWSLLYWNRVPMQVFYRVISFDELSDDRRMALSIKDAMFVYQALGDGG